jgi:UDP-N-acetyl-2-amino-2-deoxyglucuronate dehydrogenase
MVGVAIVGLGMGRNRARQVKETEGAELKVVVDLNAELAENVAGEMGCDWTPKLADALGRSDVDLVFLLTPSGLHAELGVAAAQAGKHVITTKPMDVSTLACDELIAAGDAAGVLVGVDYQSRYVDNNVRVAEALRQGWLGKPILGEVRFKWFRSQEYFDHGNGWRGTWAMDGGGALANQGSHLIDLLLWFMGDPVRVYGETAVMSHDIETEDIGLAIINFASGAKGTVMGTTTFPTSVYFGAEVHGTEGGVLIEAALDGTMRVIGEGLEEKIMGLKNPFKNVVEDVVSALENGTQLRVDGKEGRRTVALLEQIYASAKKGEAISV